MSWTSSFRVFALGGIVGLTSWAAVSPAHGQLIAPASTRGFWQTIQARKFLQEDPQLAPHTLGVKVVNGVGILWGPVPSAELSYRAEVRLRSMVELVDVRNELTITDEEAPTPLLKPATPQFLPDRLPPVLPTEPRGPAGIRKFLQPTVELVGELQPIEPITVNASPAAALETPTVRVHWLGTIQLPAMGGEKNMARPGPK